MRPSSSKEDAAEEPMGSNLSFMELLAAVGQNQQHPNTRYEQNHFPPDPYGTPTDLDCESSRADNAEEYFSPVSNYSSDQDFAVGGRSTERCLSWNDSELEDNVEPDDIPNHLPAEGDCLYDYEYPISDNERLKSPPPEVQTVPLSADIPSTGWKKRQRHPKGEVLPNCRKSTGMGAVEIAMRRSATRTTTHIFEPVVGMKFDSVGEAHSFFNLYSWEKGFGIRYGKSYTNRGNKYRSMQEIECGNAGFDNRVKHQSKRCDCKVMIRLHRTDDHGWYISRYDAEHNHELSTSCGEKMQWPSHRHIDEHTRDMIKCLRENNISLTKVHGVLGSFFGSVKDLPFTKRSLRTVCSQIAREQLDDDVKKTLELFRKIRDEDPDFAFSVDVDEQNRIKTLIWTNQRSKMQYSCFGDAVTFDTTYCTNIYKMPFGLFVGVNNHFQSVIYAGVLMKDESITSFAWVFKEFISLMGGKHPMTILTDQAKAMEEALKIVMPMVVHLWCKWHIMNKAKEGLGPVYTRNLTFRQQFFKVINEMLTIDEFEAAWHDLITRYSLTKNPFMVRTYEVRHKWAKPYSKDKFCARMMSTQRSESANHMLKTYVPRYSSLNRFVEMYNALLYDRSVEEDREEHKTKQEVKRLKGCWPIQRHAYEVYTNASYKLFSQEFDRGTQYVVFSESEPDVYRVHHTNAEKREAWARVDFKVRVVGDGQFYDCECGLYQHFGILCCHAIRVLVHLGVGKIPPAHILKRWTKNARDVMPPHLAMYQKDNPSMRSATFRHSLLYMSSIETVKIGNTDSETAKIVMRKNKEAREECAQSLASRGIQLNPEPDFVDSSDDDRDSFDRMGYQSGPEILTPADGTQYQAGCSNGLSAKRLANLKAPLITRKVGRPKQNRFLAPSECDKSGRTKKQTGKNVLPRAGSQTKFCRVCRQSGHNSSTCDQRDGPPKAKKPSRCSSCNLPGHKMNQCLSKIPTPEDLDMEI